MSLVRNIIARDLLQRTVWDADLMLRNRRPDREVLHYVTKKLKVLYKTPPYVKIIWDDLPQEKQEEPRVLNEVDAFSLKNLNKVFENDAKSLNEAWEVAFKGYKAQQSEQEENNEDDFY